MKLYIAGPMRGKPNFNFPAFHEAQAILERMGHSVFSPARNDIERHGKDISNDNPEGSIEKAVTQHGFSLRVALGEDLRFICEEADGVVFLPGWEFSSGATAEWSVARALGLKIFYMDDLRALEEYTNNVAA